MPKIFISYRRDDSAYVAGILGEKLQDAFGKMNVFLDIDTIPFGVDFREHISNAVGECDILLAIIGDSWIDATTTDGHRRIDMPTDFVRLELESALKRGIPVVPVLVDAARMPTESELPASLQSLAYRNAAELRPGRDLKHHINLLIRGIESVAQTQGISTAKNIAPEAHNTHINPLGRPGSLKAAPNKNESLNPEINAIKERMPFFSSAKAQAKVFLWLFFIGTALWASAVYISLQDFSNRRIIADLFGYPSLFFLGGAGIIATILVTTLVRRFRSRLKAKID